MAKTKTKKKRKKSCQEIFSELVIYQVILVYYFGKIGLSPQKLSAALAKLSNRPDVLEID